jgi:hypothetical protein
MGGPVNHSTQSDAGPGRPALEHRLVAVAAAVIGLAATVALYLGLVHAVPLVDWGTDEEALLRSEGAIRVRSASVFAVLAGGLLMLRRSYRAGGTAVIAAVLPGALAGADTIVSWGLLLLYSGAVAAGCVAAARRPAPALP